MVIKKSDACFNPSKRVDCKSLATTSQTIMSFHSNFCGGLSETDVAGSLVALMKESFNSTHTQKSFGFINDLYNQVIRLLDAVVCFASNNHWDWISSADLPGQACGVPRLAFPDRNYLIPIGERFGKTLCSQPETCIPPECDPYKSVFKHCFAAGLLFDPLREPIIDDWQSDDAFVRHFLEGVHPLALRMVTSLQEIKEELRSLTFMVDRRQETVTSLLS